MEGKISSPQTGQSSQQRRGLSYRKDCSGWIWRWLSNNNQNIFQGHLFGLSEKGERVRIILFRSSKGIYLVLWQRDLNVAFEFMELKNHQFSSLLTDVLHSKSSWEPVWPPNSEKSAWLHKNWWKKRQPQQPNQKLCLNHKSILKTGGQIFRRLW